MQRFIHIGEVFEKFMSNETVKIRIADLVFWVELQTYSELSHTSESSSPELLCSADKIFKGSVKGYEAYSIIYGYRVISSGCIVSDLSSSLRVQGSLETSPLVLVMPNGEYGPKVETQLYNGKLIEKVTIVRLGWTEGVLQELDKQVFSTVRVIGFNHNMRFIAMALQYTKKETDIQVFNQLDGKATGHKVASVDYGKNELTAK
jgi:hypothetical protein